MKSRRHIDRKTAIENTLRQLDKTAVSQHECEQIAMRLKRELEFLCEPEARMPRFKGLLNAVWIAVSNDQS